MRVVYPAGDRLYIEEANQRSYTAGMTRIMSPPVSSPHAEADGRGSRRRNRDVDRGVRVQAGKHVAVTGLLSEPSAPVHVLVSTSG